MRVRVRVKEGIQQIGVHWRTRLLRNCL